MTVGKAKRIRSVLNWAIDNDYEKGEKLVKQIIELVRANGGFKTDSPNYVGESVVGNCKDVLKSLGIILGPDGIVTPMLFDTLPMVEQEKALKVYVERTKRGVEDAALLVGTGKDLLEAVSAYVLQEKWGSTPSFMNFPTLLGQAFTALDLATTSSPKLAGETVQKRMERAFYETACSILES